MAHSHDEQDHAHGAGHEHGHSPGGDHAHSHAPPNFSRAFVIGIVLNTGFVIVEVIYGLLAHSLALVADAGHNLSDVLGLFLAWGAAVLTGRAATPHYTYGFKRSSVLAALANAIFLLVSVGAIAWEALQRLRAPSTVSASTIIWVAVVGIIVNGITALLFMSGRKNDLNIRGAFLHMAADAVISAGVVVAGVVIVFTEWFWIDPVVSLIVSAIIVFGTWSLLRESVNLSLDAVPEGINSTAVHEYLLSLPTVVDAHHLHIWGLSTTEVALTVHLILATGTSGDELLATVNRELRERFRIGHATIQFESRREPECEKEDCA
ncbi:MAG TPA: cation diffusion facilitator family transporter [Chthoniobacter sp.]|jgi:cobalt-zinc-cadmium efflux system protein